MLVLFGFLFMGCILYIFVQTSGFYGRIWHGSRLLRVYPQWKKLQQTPPPNGRGLSARAGPGIRRPVSGWVMMVLGGLITLGVLILVGKAIRSRDGFLIAISFLPLSVAILFFSFGATSLIGTRTIVCPYCGKSVNYFADVCCYICLYCKKSSIRQGDSFTLEEYLRSLPQFKDLPQF